MLQPVPAIASTVGRSTTFVCCCFCDPIVTSRSPLYFLASHSVSRARVCGHVLTRGPNRIETTSGGGLLNANRMRIVTECTFCVGAQMCIEANGMLIQFAFVDKCEQTLRSPDFVILLFFDGK